MVDINSPDNASISMVLDEKVELKELLNEMSLPTQEVVYIPVGNDRQLRAKFYYPPQLRKDEFIEFPLVLHV